MSAIVGIYYLDGRPVERLDLERMLTILAHRGPDGVGAWNGGAVGLGQRMLWTTPESRHEQLPLVHRSGDLVLTADARIDNRDELVHALGFEERPPGQITDGELILRAYEKWGERCPEQLLGDFVFAIWDGHRQALFCARDPFGIKPFYYYSRPGSALAFASEIKALTCIPWVPCQLNETRVADYLASVVEDKTITFYREILRLPPAHSMTVSRSGLLLREYWSLDPGREIHYDSDEDYAEAFRTIFAEAVRCRLRSAYPVGVTLSGGLDSSSIVCMARDMLRETVPPSLHTFSCVFDQVPECDERSYINAVLAGGGIQPHYVHPDRLGALADIDRVLWHQDQPFYIRNLFMWIETYRIAQCQGVRVILDGEDGDTVVSYGEERLAQLAYTGQWAAFGKEINALAHHFQSYHMSAKYWLRAYGLTHLTRLARSGRWIAFAQAAQEIHRHFGLSRWHLLWKHGLRPVIPAPARRLWRLLRGHGIIPASDGSFLRPGFVQRVGFVERATALVERYTQYGMPKGEHLLSLTAGITSCIHEENDKAAASFGIETRHPFWDRRLVEFCLALPPEFKIRQGWPRWILRQAMEGILPDTVQWRVGKSNLSANFQHCVLELERERLEEVLAQGIQPIEDYVDVPSLREAYGRGEANAIWPAVILSLWLQQAHATLGGTG